MQNNQKIPEGWSVKKGKDISSLITKGASPKWQGFEYCDSGTLFVTSENVRDGFLDISNPKFLPNAFSEKQKRSKLKNGDILINIVGASIGRSCLYNKDIPANINQAVCLFRCNSAAHNLYTLLYLSLPKTIRTLLETQTESARPNLSLSDISLLNFLLPPLPEQEKIAGILGTWDEAIEKLSNLIEQKKLLKKGLMQKLLYNRTDTLTYKVADLFELGRGRVISKDEIEANKGDYPVYSSQTSNNGILGYINSYDFQGEYITWTTDGANAGEVFYRNGKFNCTNVCGTAKAKEKNVNLYYAMSFLNHISKKYVSYVGNPKLMNGVFAIIPLILPDIEIQDKVASVLSTADDEINLLNQKLEALKEQKKGLMQQLLTGQIRVKVN